MTETADERRARILGEVLDACERGELDPLERACTEHPDLAGELRAAARVVLDLRALHGADGPPRGVPGRGARIGRFVVLGEIGRGGMGVVLRARDESLGRDVALKLIASPIAPSSETMARFRGEARALARLRHPHIVSILEIVETPEGWPCFAMDLVEGEGLDRILSRLAGADPAALDASALLPAGAAARGEPYPRAVAALVAKVADALAQAHGAGVIHRDVKPGNVLVDARGEPRLVDFGLARDLNASSHTRTGRGLGTPVYMAPEQIDGRGRSIDARTDVYALGATLYEAIALRRPFLADTSQETFRLILERDPEPPHALHRGVPRDLETICMKAIEKDPARRYASAAAFASDLRAFLDGRPIEAHASGPVTRAIKHVRRNPWPSIAGLAASCAVVGFVTIWVLPGAMRADAARSARDEVQGLLSSFRALAAGIAERESRLAAFERDQDRNVVDWAARMARMNDEQPLLDAARRAWEDTGDALRRARTRAVLHAPQNGSLFKLCAEASVELWRELAQDDARRGAVVTALNTSTPFQRSERDRRDARQVLDHWRSTIPADRAEIERFADALADRATISFAELPPGVALYLFRYVTPSGANPVSARNRVVPIPVSPGLSSTELPVPWAGSGGSRGRELHPGDVMLVVEGVAPGSPAARAGIRAGDLVSDFPNFPIDGRVHVRSVRPGGPAAAAGVQPWDVLASIDESAEPREPELHYVVRGVKAGSTCTVDFFHDGELIHVAWSPTDRAFCYLRSEDLEHDLGVELGSADDALAAAPPAAGVEIRWLSSDGLRSARLEGGTATGLKARATVSPLWCTRGNSLGVTPAPDAEIPAGSYLVILRRANAPDVSVPLFLEPAARASIPGAAAGPPGPDGFVYVAPGTYLSGGDDNVKYPMPLRSRTIDGFWIGRTEATTAEYLDFLNRPETAPEIVDCTSSRKAPSHRELARVPRDVMNETIAPQIFALRGTDGRFAVPWDGSLPIHGVSYDDAIAYCAWRSRRANARGEPWEFRLPTSFELEKAARGVDGRLFPWGNGWETNFPKGLTEAARGRTPTELHPARVGRYLYDESPYGARDCSGNLLEYCTTFGTLPGMRTWRSGNCDDPRLNQAFRAANFEDGLHDRPSAHDGFRVVAQLRDR